MEAGTNSYRIAALSDARPLESALFRPRCDPGSPRSAGNSNHWDRSRGRVWNYRKHTRWI